jgi:hypothetical protein
MFSFHRIPRSRSTGTRIDGPVSMKDTRTKKLESCPAIHSALNHFELAKLPLDPARDPGCRERVLDGAKVSPETASPPGPGGMRSPIGGELISVLPMQGLARRNADALTWEESRA